VSHGIFLYSLRNLEMVALFPSGYHLEGTSPYMDRLLISEGKNLYYCSPTGQDLFLITDNFAHQDRGYSGGKSAYWSQDLDRIFFLGYTNNLKRIFSIKPDGTDLKPITEATSSYILIDTVVNGDLYWEQESPRYSERQTNLESSKTNIIYWSFFHDTEFSDDGKLILDWQRNLPIFTDIQTLETWKDPMIFGIRELTEGGHFSIGYSNEYINRRDAEITLSELILVGDEFQSAHIGTAWWNPDNERFMACVSMCVAPSAWCECNHYYLLDINGQLIKELILPEVIDYQYDWSIDGIVEVISGPQHFLANPWSPDGNYLIFRNYSSLILHDVVNDTNIEIEAFPPTSLSQIPIYWIADGDNYLESINNLTNSAESSIYVSDNVYQATQQSSIEALPSHIDITSAEYSITEDQIEVEIKLRDLPTSLLTNRAGVCDNCWEYLWGVFIDNDNNENTGGVEGLDVPVGWEYALIITINHKAGQSQSKQSISEIALAQRWECHSATSWITENNQLDLSLNPTDDSISISGTIPNLSKDARIVIYTFDYNPSGDIQVDLYSE